MTPFDFLNAINYSKEKLIVDDLSEKEYNPYMVNRGMSYFPDTILIANEMNVWSGTPKKLQNDFHLSLVRKRRRYTKWEKYKTNDVLESVKKYYGYSSEKARIILGLLTEDQLQTIKEKTSTGGR